jgi:hypothetical protein
MPLRGADTSRATHAAGSLSRRERVGVRGYKLSIGPEPPHPNPLPFGETE